MLLKIIYYCMISIAMASYNGARYIREQIDSILNQTIHEFELVICDDCSTDNTVAIINEYAKADNRFRVYVNDINIGYRRNFEKAALLCKGEFIAFCDQDDIWLPNHLEVLSENIGDRDVCTANAEIIGGDGNPLGYKLSDFTRLEYWSEIPLIQAYTYWYYRNPFPGCNTMYRSHFLQHAYPIGNNNIQLHDTWLDTIACTCGNGIKYVDDVTMLYRFHQDSVTATSKRLNKQNPFHCFLRKFLSSYKSYVMDRLYYCQEIIDRKIEMSNEQKYFFEQAQKYHIRRNSFWGRTKNLLFDVRHFREIYNI